MASRLVSNYLSTGINYSILRPDYSTHTTNLAQFVLEVVNGTVQVSNLSGLNRVSSDLLGDRHQVVRCALGVLAVGRLHVGSAAIQVVEGVVRRIKLPNI